MWKQGEGQIQYMYQNEGSRTLFYYKTKSDIKHNRTTSTQKTERWEQKGLWVVCGKSQGETAGGQQTGLHASQGKGEEVYRGGSSHARQNVRSAVGEGGEEKLMP